MILPNDGLYPSTWLCDDITWLCVDVLLPDAALCRMWISQHGLVYGIATTLGAARLDELVTTWHTTIADVMRQATTFDRVSLRTHLIALANAPEFQRWNYRDTCGLLQFLGQDAMRMVGPRCTCDLRIEGCHCAIGKAELEAERRRVKGKDSQATSQGNMNHDV